MTKVLDSDDKQCEQMVASYKELLVSIGENPEREGLEKTPQRAANAFKFLTKGYDMNVSDLVGEAIFSSDNSEMVLLKNIDLISICEHHLLPIIGKCHVAYLPKGKIIGLSKIPRIVDMFARRLQLQENLTVQIAKSIAEVTGSWGVGVVVEAKHFCMVARGVEKKNITVTTSSMVGAFLDSAKTRQEFLSLLK